jgi:hypothetical protein
MSENAKMIIVNLIISLVTIIVYFFISLFLLMIRVDFVDILAIVDIAILILSPVAFIIIHAAQTVFKTSNKVINIILWILVLIPFSCICLYSFTLPFLDFIVYVIL